MAQVLVFSNEADWDSDSIGFIQAVDVDLTAFAGKSDAVVDVAIKVAGRFATDDYEVINGDEEDIGDVFECFEISTYCKPDFEYLVVFRSEKSDILRPVVMAFIFI